MASFPGFTAEAALGRTVVTARPATPYGTGSQLDVRPALQRGPVGALRASDWLECEEHCWKRCNDPACYGWCYWSCVIRGGPSVTAPGILA